jgi:hypothetical protein
MAHPQTCGGPTAKVKSVQIETWRPTRPWQIGEGWYHLGLIVLEITAYPPRCLNVWLPCAGLVCTGGCDIVMKGFDPRQGGNAVALNPLFSVKCPDLEGPPQHREIDHMISAAPLGGEFSSQILTGV